jgi:hypothetical protein
MRALALAVLLFAACGTVTADPHDAGGTGGQLAAATGGQGGHDVAGAGGAAGTPTTSTGGAGGAPCLGPDTTGFAFNQPCPMGDAAACVYSSDRCCYAHCTLNSDQFVGCVSGSPVASRCHASCSDCP